MRKRVLTILADGFEEIEAITCIDILRRGGIEVVVAGLDNLEVNGSREVKVIADLLLDQITGDFDALVLPGGPGAQKLAASSKVKELIENIEVVAAICATPATVLAPTGILNNKKATCFPEMEDAFDDSTQFSQDRVVVDGNVITSRAPGTALEFALAIVEKLSGPNVSAQVKKSTLSV